MTPFDRPRRGRTHNQSDRYRSRRTVSLIQTSVLLMISLAEIRAALADRGVERIDAVAILGSGMSVCFDADEYVLLHDGGSDVAGHSGGIGLLEREGRYLLLGLGRRHLYEGYAPGDITSLVRAAFALGAGSLLVTNAAGGLHPLFSAGDIMLIEDCLTTMIGPRLMRDGGMGASLPDGSRCRRELFTGALGPLVIEGAIEHGVTLRRGVYAAVAGPSYETRAEIGMLRRMGADAVGMSTVPEAAEAARLGMRTVGLSLITNVLTDTTRVALDHTDVVEQGRAGAKRMRWAIEAALAALR